MRRINLIVIISLAVCAGLIVLATTLYYTQPTVLRVAVVRDSEDQAIMNSAAHIFTKDHEGIHLRIVPADDLKAASTLLAEGKADLAVLRSDIAMPSSGRTLLIMRRNAVLIFAPDGSGVHEIGDLAGKRIGVLRTASHAGARLDNAGTEALLALVLTQYDVPAAGVTKLRLSLAEIPDALRRHQIDAVLAVDAQEAPDMAAAINAVALSSAQKVVFLPINEAEAIAKRLPNLDVIEIVRGVFGGATPPRPAENFDTLGSTTRLVATTRLSDGTAAEVTRLLLAAQPELATHIPIANQIKAPDPRKDAVLPVHTGTLAYLEDEEETFFQRYSDLFYIGVMMLSLFGTGMATMIGRLRQHKIDAIDDDLQKLLDLIMQARLAHDDGVLDSCEAETEVLFARLLTPANVQLMGPARISALGITLEEMRFILREKRAEPALREPPPHALNRALVEALSPRRQAGE
ncbi:TAXI family TRAP transporter solute-binding subunit [Beijerinckia indica]|uniref:TRAP transporter solute receptor, TAXI family n=1 Tax=Beijerinckia indica subsp. indica (strain ATCC 9039 / DSM 1715 / NCIMB 8712) TaxID=395963 RepID=B2IEP7_BEII9|nr:TAXI family TRAP transporter solute-binding subunit [Beijerinckia indica]ACB96987.1 TRAP transporter solute receptor, TAXI family [Beijerinckia indica subsp. indica ATCC 9039]